MQVSNRHLIVMSPVMRIERHKTIETKGTKFAQRGVVFDVSKVRSDIFQEI